MTFLKMTELDLQNKRVLIREDLNVPVENGKIMSDLRILAALPTIEYCVQHGAKVIVMSHLGRPMEGKYDPDFSLEPVADLLAHLLGQSVRFKPNGLDEPFEMESGDVVLLENVRFNPGEKANSPELAKKMAALCDVFVMDAFATAHRAEASTCGVAKVAPIACAGPLLIAELTALQKALQKPQHPMIAIVGGSKVSSKLLVLDSLIKVVDQLIVGGGIANTFIAASGFDVGKSLYEPDLIPQAQQLLKLAKERGAAIPIPTDVVVAKSFSKEAKPIVKSVKDVAPDEMILDIGPETAQQLAAHLVHAGTILWNGPVGVFEWDAFAEGTKTIAEAISQSQAFSIAGGGDTLAAIDKYHLADRISYISTGGGAFLEFIEGKKLPAVVVLEQRAS